MTTSPNRSVDATLQVLIGRLPPATTDFLKVSLEPHGMGVEIEPDPSKVVAFSLEKSFDCILVGADPLTLGELFVRGSAKVPVIALVEEGSGQARVRALEAGAQECLKAPFGIGELVGRIRALAGSGPSCGSCSRTSTWGEAPSRARAWDASCGGGTTKPQAGRCTPRRAPTAKDSVDRHLRRRLLLAQDRSQGVLGLPKLRANVGKLMTLRANLGNLMKLRKNLGNLAKLWKSARIHSTKRQC